MTKFNCEVTAEDLAVLDEVFKHLDTISSDLSGSIETLEIRVQATGGDTFTVGYGASGDPAVIAVEPYDPAWTL